MAGHSCHRLLSPFTGIDLSRNVQIMVTNLQNLIIFYISLLKKKYYLKIIIERPMMRATSGMNGLIKS